MNREKSNWISLFAANFIGILNDNFLKNSIIFIGVTWAMPSWLNLSQLTTLVAAGLVIPYLIFSPLSGRIAVNYTKQATFRWCKIAEFPIVLIACFAFWKEWIGVALVSVFLMGVQSCLYSPAKYGLIRDIGGEEGIPFGSGMLETMAFLGILTGTVVASFMADHSPISMVCASSLLFALIGYLLAKNIKVKELPIEPSINNSINPIRFLKQSYLFAKHYPGVNMVVFGISMFWLMGGMLQMNIIIHCKQALCISSAGTGVVMAVAATGIASGCLFAGKIAKRGGNRRTIFTGLGLMMLFLSLILLLRPGTYLFASLIFLFSFAGGLFEVPCLSMIQQIDVGRKIGDMLAYMNFVTFIFILVGSFIFWLITYITHENSMTVFATLLFLCAFTLIVMVVHRSLNTISLS